MSRIIKNIARMIIADSFNNIYRLLKEQLLWQEMI